MKAYKPFNRINLIIKESQSSKNNQEEKNQFTKQIKDAAIGLSNNFGNPSIETEQNSEDF